MKSVKVILILIASLMLTSLYAVGGNDNSAPEEIGLEIKQKDNPPTPLRAPLYVNIEAIYDAVTSTISIIFNGEDIGEVRLYLDGQCIEVSSQINCIFHVTQSGYYQTIINTPNWTAEGGINL